MIDGFRPKDLKEVLSLCKLFHEESIYHDCDYDEEKLKWLFFQCTINPSYKCFVYRRDNKIIGLSVNYITEHFFGHDKEANNLILYVLPEYRGSRAAYRLIDLYEIWADSLGCKEIYLDQRSSIDTEKTTNLFKKLGYNVIGSHTMKRI